MGVWLATCQGGWARCAGGLLLWYLIRHLDILIITYSPPSISSITRMLPGFSGLLNTTGKVQSHPHRVGIKISDDTLQRKLFKRGGRKDARETHIHRVSWYVWFKMTRTEMWSEKYMTWKWIYHFWTQRIWMRIGPVFSYQQMPTCKSNICGNFMTPRALPALISETLPPSLPVQTSPPHRSLSTHHKLLGLLHRVQSTELSANSLLHPEVHSFTLSNSSEVIRPDVLFNRAEENCCTIG